MREVPLYGGPDTSTPAAGGRGPQLPGDSLPGAAGRRRLSPRLHVEGSLHVMMHVCCVELDSTSDSTSMGEAF